MLNRLLTQQFHSVAGRNRLRGMHSGNRQIPGNRLVTPIELLQSSGDPEHLWGCLIVLKDAMQLQFKTVKLLCSFQQWLGQCRFAGGGQD